MSSEAQTKKQLFFFYAPDCTDPDAPARREEFRDQHAGGVTNLLNGGLSKFCLTLLKAHNAHRHRSQNGAVVCSQLTQKARR